MMHITIPVTLVAVGGLLAGATVFFSTGFVFGALWAAKLGRYLDSVSYDGEGG